MKSYMQRFAVLVPIVFLVGCAKPSMGMRERLLRDGYPPAYAEGFEAGHSCGFDNPLLFSQASAECDSLINKEGGKIINMDAHRHRYAEDKSYAQGWDDGVEEGQGARLSYDDLNENMWDTYWLEKTLERQDRTDD